MSNRANKPQSRPMNRPKPDVPEDISGEDSSWAPTKNALLQILDGLASLRLTVALFAMAIFIVLAGTLGQVHRDIWDVVHDYFRMTPEGGMAVTWTIPLINKEVILSTPVTRIDLNIFFPPAFSSDGTPPDLSTMTAPARLWSSIVIGFGWSALLWLIPFRDRKFQLVLYGALGATLSLLTAKFGGFWFPKGWTIGAVMAVNLLAAHLMRFKIQSSGKRLWAGAGVIALGILATYGVIMSGSNKEGVLKENWLLGAEVQWSTIWIMFKMLLAVLVVLGVYGYILLWRRALQDPDQSFSQRTAHLALRRVAGLGTLAMAGLLIYLIQGGDEMRLGDSGMRILWQLLKATFAGLVLLAGCALVFRKRAGVVVLHAGVALLMLSELLVGISAQEGQMTIVEGESSNYVQDIRSIELAVIDPSDPEKDKVVAIPKRFIKEGNTIQDERLPVNIRVDKVYKNSTLEKPKPGESNPADSGYGRTEIAQPIQGSTGTDNASNVDLASAYVTLYTKEDEKNLGTWLVSQLRTAEQPFQVDGKTYSIAPAVQADVQALHDHLERCEPHELRRHQHAAGLPVHHRPQRSLPQRGPPGHRDLDEQPAPLRRRDVLPKRASEPASRTRRDRPASRHQRRLDDPLCVLHDCGGRHAGPFSDGVDPLPEPQCPNPQRSALASDYDDNNEGDGRKNPLLAKHRPAQAALMLDPIRQPPKNRWITPVLSAMLILIFGGYLAGKARIPKPTEEGFDLYEAGQIPVAYDGRVKPLDTLARNSLRIMSNKQEFVGDDDEKQPAMLWLLDLIARQKESNQLRVFRIDYQPLLDVLKLPKREGHMYSFEEIMKREKEFKDQVQRAANVENEKKRTIYQKKVLELAKRLQLRNHLAAAFHHQKIQGKETPKDLLDALERNSIIKEAVESGEAKLPLLYSRTTGQWELYNTISIRRQVMQLAKKYQSKDAAQLAGRMVRDFSEPLAANAIRRLRIMVLSVSQKSHQTFAETAADFASKSDDATMKQVFGHLAEAGPQDRDDDLATAAKLPADRVRDLAEQEAAAEFSRRDAPLTGERAMALLELLAENSITKALDGQPLDAKVMDAPYDEIFDAYAAQNADAFNKAVADYQTEMAAHPPTENGEPISPEKLRFESFFNNAAPFYYLAAVYLIAGLFAAASWLTCSRPLNRATFWLLCFVLVVHTAALIGRIYISGRPPVTNLYSSAVFIGWGCVLIGLLFEWFYDIGIGNLVAAVAGFMTLGVAHLLTTEVASFRGDSFTVMQAVLGYAVLARDARGLHLDGLRHDLRDGALRCALYFRRRLYPDAHRCPPKRPVADDLRHAVLCDPVQLRGHGFGRTVGGRFLGPILGLGHQGKRRADHRALECFGAACPLGRHRQEPRPRDPRRRREHRRQLVVVRRERVGDWPALLRLHRRRPAEPGACSA